MEILNIQKFSVHDGDGIRTTIFFKGCPLDCVWCHNPESKSFYKQIMYNIEKCRSCFKCVDACSNGCISRDGDFIKINRNSTEICENAVLACSYGALEIAGKNYTVKELVKEALKDRMFYETSGGGVTLSGGEVMAQNSDFILQLCKALYDKGINVAIDTCGYAPFSKFVPLLKYVDTFLYDLKFMNPVKHENYTGKDNVLILENLKLLSKAGAKIYLRVPLVEGVNAEDEDIDNIITFLKENDINPAQINLLPYHSYGTDKCARLSIEYYGGDFSAPPKERVDLFLDRFYDAGFRRVKEGG